MKFTRTSCFSVVILSVLTGLYLMNRIPAEMQRSSVSAANSNVELEASKPVDAVLQTAAHRVDDRKTAVPTTAPVPEVAVLKYPVPTVPGHTSESVDLLSALLRHPELELTKAELSALLELYVDTGRERTALEATLAEVEDVSPTERIITIPAYSEQGREIEEQMYESFAEVVGATRTAEIRDLVEGELYFRNRGFGEARQVIQARLTGSSSQIEYEILHSVGELHAAVRLDDGSRATVTSSSAGRTARVSIFDLGAYAGLADLLPKGGEG